MQNCSDWIIEFLEGKGIEHAFTVSGGGSIWLNDALARAKKMKYVACHHEQAAAMATEAYCKLRGLGLTVVTSGPGGTNAITGVAGSWLDGNAHIVISGQAFLKHTIGSQKGNLARSVPPLRQLGVQEINIIDLVRPITKYAVMVEKAEDLQYHMERAIYEATHGRPGPVWLDIPGDIQNAPFPSISFSFRVPAPPVYDIKDQVAKVKKLLWSSKRPLFHIGQGARHAQEVFFRLIDTLQVPYVTARNANDMGRWGDPLLVGRPGTFAQRGANFAVQASDLYIAVGTRLSITQTGYNTKDYARNAQIIQVNIDLAELEKGTLRDPINIECDAKTFLEELERQWHEPTEWIQWSVWTRWEQWTPWLKKCQEWKKKYPVCLPEYEEGRFVDSYYLIDVLSDLAGPTVTIVTDMGFAFQNTHQAWKTKTGQRLLTSCGLASMGWGLPAAIGAAMETDRQVICITGDGGFSMTQQELATMVYHNLPITIILLNNRGYLTIKQTQEFGFEGRKMGVDYDSGLWFPQFDRLANAYCLSYKRIYTNDTVREKLQEALLLRSCFIEVMMDPDQPQAPRFLNRRNPDGTMNPTALEDAHPFLPPEEVEREMNEGRNCNG